MINILVTFIGLTSIAFIIWWFWFNQNTAKSFQNDNTIVIKVKDGVYQPDIIQIPCNQSLTLRFIREDASPCTETVIFNNLNINKQLSLGQPTDISILLKQPGEYEFTCQMGMYRGKLIAL